MARVWKKGEPWRVAGALNMLRRQIREHAPRSVPPATKASSWGTIADSAHSQNSDHYPHYYSWAGDVAIVLAGDYPHAPHLGLNIHAICEQLRVSQDSRIQYIISNRRITGPNYGWQWAYYTGTDPHDTHAHVSLARRGAADNQHPFRIVVPQPEEDEMSIEEIRTALRQELSEGKWLEYYDEDGDGTRDPRSIPDMLFSIPRLMATIRGETDEKLADFESRLTTVEQNTERIIALLTEIRDGNP